MTRAYYTKFHDNAITVAYGATQFIEFSQFSVKIFETRRGLTSPEFRSISRYVSTTRPVSVSLELTKNN